MWMEPSVGLRGREMTKAPKLRDVEAIRTIPDFLRLGDIIGVSERPSRLGFPSRWSSPPSFRVSVLPTLPGTVGAEDIG